MMPLRSKWWFVCGWAMPSFASCAVPELREAEIFDFAALEEEALADRLRREPGPVRLCGWSLGGMLALEAALVCPEKVGGLRLISSTACFCSEDPLMGTPVKQVRAMRMLLRRRPAEVLARFYEDAAAPFACPETRKREWIAYWLEQDPQSALLCRGLEFLERTDLRSQLRKLTVPVQLVHGRQDRVIPPGAARSLARSLGASLIELDGGHDLLLRDGLLPLEEKKFQPGIPAE